MRRIPSPVIGMWGTFDVDNYGDHLFPLIAERELRRRLPDVELRFASPYGRLHPTRFDGRFTIDPLPPWSAANASELVASHDCVLIGGGEILHGNDRMLAPVYGVSQDELAQRRASGWFLEAAAVGRGRRPSVPFVWNAVGIGDPVDPRVPVAAAAVDVAVRDAGSAARLRAAGFEGDLRVVPDAAFLLDRLWRDDELATRRVRLRARGALPAGRYVAVQGCDLLVPHAPALADALTRWLDGRADDLDVVLVETGRCRRDDEFADALEAVIGRPTLRMPVDVDLVDVDAVIAGAEVFAGSSLHGCITAFVHGRPFVTLNLARESKLDGLGDTTGLTRQVIHVADDLPAALAASAQSMPSAVALRDLQRRVHDHFDLVAETALVAAAARRPRMPRETRAGRRRRPALSTGQGSDQTFEVSTVLSASPAGAPPAGPRRRPSPSSQSFSGVAESSVVDSSVVAGCSVVVVESSVASCANATPADTTPNESTAPSAAPIKRLFRSMVGVLLGWGTTRAGRCR